MLAIAVRAGPHVSQRARPPTKTGATTGMRAAAQWPHGSHRHRPACGRRRSAHRGTTSASPISQRAPGAPAPSPWAASRPSSRSSAAQLVITASAPDNPHQRTRVGEALIAQETARHWIHRAALLAENPAADTGDTAATVNLARIAAETATLGAIQIVQRALGMAAFRAGAMTELLFRDLAIYLRQPAPDETLTEAAAHFMQRDLPPL